MIKLTDRLTWTKLQKHHEQLRAVSLKKLFQENPKRFEQFSVTVTDLLIDYSKNIITQETVDLLCELAVELKLKEAIKNLFLGEKINISENKAALHMALRAPEAESNKAVHVELNRMAKIAEALNQKKLLGYTQKPINTILHVGMGGSDLGVRLFDQAMDYQKDISKNAQCYFLTKFDLADIKAKLKLCNPETTIVIIASKSFTTPETMMIYKTIQAWFPDDQKLKSTSQFYAVTEKTERALAAGFLEDNILRIWDWVGGRYSVWSAVNFANILVYGIEVFKRFLHGAHQMDLHFQHADFKKNGPVITALLCVWYNNFFHLYSKAIVPYSLHLKLLPAFLQQLHMESLGKNVLQNGEKINYPTGQLVWGDIGPNSQHSFHQLLMQGTQTIPVDFILELHCDNNKTLNEYDIKRAANCLAQSQTLMQGTSDAKAHQHIEGNRPSTTILIDQLTPEALGALLALYEHQVFVQSVMWGINPFDQWGVEHGKKVADILINSLSQNKLPKELDASTMGLLEKIIGRVQK